MGRAQHFFQEKLTFVSNSLSTHAEVSGKLIILQLTLKFFKQCFITYQGPRLWNNLPDDLKNCGSVDTFKFMYKGVFNNYR